MRAFVVTGPSGRARRVVVYIGLAGVPSYVDTRSIALKDLRVVGVLGGSAGLAGAITSFADGTVDPRPLVAATVGLGDVARILDGWRPADAGPGPKIHIDPAIESASDPFARTRRTTGQVCNASEGTAMKSTAFNRTAIAAAYLSGAIALAYSLTFGYYVRNGANWAQYASSGVLVAGGLMGLPVLVALYQRLRFADEGFALVALLIAAVAAFGSTLHGAHDVAIFANPDQAGSATAFPNFTDPRGFATFALFGLGLVMLSLLVRSVGFSARTSLVGVFTGVSTIVVYIGRVTVLDPQRWWVAIAAIASGVIGLPLWNVLVARDLARLSRRDREAQPIPSPAFADR